MQKPEKGFYYHYKQDPLKDEFNYAYEVLNIAHHTEVEGLEESAMVVYRPLYEAPVYKIGKHWDVRPINMFMEEVVKDGEKIPRFRKITDENLIKKLKEKAKEMYL
jgi:hypothetical protein